MTAHLRPGWLDVLLMVRRRPGRGISAGLIRGGKLLSKGSAFLRDALFVSQTNDTAGLDDRHLADIGLSRQDIHGWRG